MTRNTLLFVGSLLVLAIAFVTVLALRSPPPLSMLRFHGSKESLETLAEAAKRCGFSQTKVEQLDKFLVLTVETTGASDTRAGCLMQWVFDHPESKISFVGNEAFSTQTRP